MKKEKKIEIIKKFENEFSNGMENAIGQKVFSTNYDCFNEEFFLKVEQFIINALEQREKEIKEEIITKLNEYYKNAKIKNIPDCFEDILWDYDKEFCSWMGEKNCFYCKKGKRDWVCDLHSTSGMAYKLLKKI